MKWPNVGDLVVAYHAGSVPRLASTILSDDTRKSLPTSIVKVLEVDRTAGCIRVYPPAGFLGADLPEEDPRAGWWICAFDLPDALPPAKVATQHSGCSCKRCKEFAPYAEPNQSDGSFLCFQCRQDPYRMSF